MRLRAASGCQLGQLSFYNFLCVEIPEFAEAECSGSGGMRVINCLNCAPVFAFRQIPPANRVQSFACQQVIVTTRWEARRSRHWQLDN